MEFQHFTHNNPLQEVYWGGTFGPCSACYLPSHGPGYECRTCDFRLHESCFEMPREISHPFHPHSLALLYQPPNADNFPKCAQCWSVCFGFIYHCNICEINLDVKCASFTENDCHQELLESKAKDTIFHTLHPSHPLFYFYCRQEFELECKPCEQPLSGPAYRCIDKNCTFFAHESCTRLPEAIRHPYHPHRLLLQAGSYSIGCGACECKIYGSCYRCAHGCNFELDILCSKFSPPAIKLNRHEHNLFCFDDNSGPSCPSSSVLCNDCGEKLSGTFYSCVRCEDFSLHATCIPIPENIKDDHIHPLTYTKPVVTEEDFKRDDNLQECYCHKCETERDPRFPYYNCEICPYNAHIGCIVSETSSQKIGGEANGKEEDFTDDGAQENQVVNDDRLSKLTEQISEIKKEIEEKTTQLMIEEEVELEILTTMLRELQLDREIIIKKRLYAINIVP